MRLKRYNNTIAMQEISKEKATILYFKPWLSDIIALPPAREPRPNGKSVVFLISL